MLDTQFVVIPCGELDKEQVLKNLENMRKEWEQAVNGKSLLHMTAPVGMLLIDICGCMGLSRDEFIRVLGSKLFNESMSMVNGH